MILAVLAVVILVALVLYVAVSIAEPRDPERAWWCQ